MARHTRWRVRLHGRAGLPHLREVQRQAQHRPDRGSGGPFDGPARRACAGRRDRPGRADASWPGLPGPTAPAPPDGAGASATGLVTPRRQAIPSGHDHALPTPSPAPGERDAPSVGHLEPAWQPPARLGYTVPTPRNGSNAPFATRGATTTAQAAGSGASRSPSNELKMVSFRGVAQPGSARASGARGPGFKSRLPDQFCVWWNDARLGGSNSLGPTRIALAPGGFRATCSTCRALASGSCGSVLDQLRAAGDVIPAVEALEDLPAPLPLPRGQVSPSEYLARLRSDQR